MRPPTDALMLRPDDAPLFDHVPEPREMMPTSTETSAAVWEKRRKQIMEALADAPAGLTGPEIAERIGVQLNKMSGRLTELYRDNMIVCLGEAVRPPSVCMARVWEISDAGREELARLEARP